MNTNIENVGSLMLKLDKLGSQETITRFLQRAGSMVERDAKRNCPVDTGNLRASIAHEVSGDTCVVGTDVEYAPYVHQGTGIYAPLGTGRTEPWSYQDADGNWHTTLGMPPRPFLSSALDSNRQAIVDLLQQMVEEDVR